MGPCEIPLPTTFAPSDANTSPGIVGATYNTNDQAFMLRAERSGPNRRRVYTITYKATDNAGNSTMLSVVIVVENPSSN